MRRIVGLAFIAFTVSVGVVVGNRLSYEAMAVIVGVVCGVFAGVPTAILLLIVARRMSPQRQEHSSRPQGNYPPVIVISPNSGQPNYTRDPWYGPPAGYLPPDFRIVGEDDEDDDW
jgi:hypothetical protein